MENEMTSKQTPNNQMRAAADPIGLRGFPSSRASLDKMVDDLKEVLITAAAFGVTGKELARHFFGADDTRQVRHLVSYARVHHKCHQIVGIAGSGYRWADENTDSGRRTLKKAAAAALAMGRAFFFIHSLHKRKGIATAAAQMVFDFMEHNITADQRRSDDLAAMFALEGTSVADFLDAVITELAKTESGQQALTTAGKKHAQLLISRAAIDDILSEIDTLRSRFVNTLATAG